MPDPIIQKFETVQNALLQKGAKCTFSYGPPTSLASIQQVENQLGVVLSPHFKATLTDIAQQLSLEWSFDEAYTFPKAIENHIGQLYDGVFSWNLDKLVELAQEKKEGIKDYQDLYADEEDAALLESAQTYLNIWENALVFQALLTGDFLAIDLHPDTYGQILFLSHDDYDDANGYLIAQDFSALLESYFEMGCFGGYFAQWATCTSGKSSGILPSSKSAAVFREWLFASNK